MEIAVGLVALVATVTVVGGLCERFELSAPIVLVALGIVASFVPFLPEVHLHAEVVLVGLLPPLLYAAALQTSLIDFNANRRPILLLSVGLVVFTTVGVGVVVHTLLPGVGWPAALALGAVVAPPDAVATTAVARRIGMPRRIVTILEGESLVNDATALVALRSAIAAGTAAVTWYDVALDFLVAAGGGVLVGVLAYKVVAVVRRRYITDAVIDTAVSMLTPFVAYVAAEEVEASGVLAVVVSGLLLGHQAPVLQTASSRIAERTNWRTISFLLENTVFLLIGLQARWILDAVQDSSLSTAMIAGLCLACLAAVIVLRLVWVFSGRYLLVRPHADPVTGNVPSPAYTMVIGWAGMRGVVTLAAAFAIPAWFPYREVLVLAALVVTAGTLLVQGLTLPWLVRRLGVPAPDPREDALARAGVLQEAGQAGMEELERIPVEDDDEGPVRALLRARVRERAHGAWEQLGHGSGTETPSEAYARLRLQMLGAERERVLQIRSTGAVPHEVVSDVLGALDQEESMLDVRVRRRSALRAALDQASHRPPVGSAAAARPAACEHLAAAPLDRTPPEQRACEDCLREGSSWVHLRLCLSCGHMGCCDSSPRRHASAHFHESGHPVVRSAEPAEEWRWCFVDEAVG
jgi:CPA1 family monovalent cation:H+ antiporter